MSAMVLRAAGVLFLAVGAGLTMTNETPTSGLPLVALGLFWLIEGILEGRDK